MTLKSHVLIKERTVFLKKGFSENQSKFSFSFSSLGEHMLIFSLMNLKEERYTRDYFGVTFISDNNAGHCLLWKNKQFNFKCKIFVKMSWRRPAERERRGEKETAG